MESSSIGRFLLWLLPESITSWLGLNPGIMPQGGGDHYASSVPEPPSEGDAAGALNRQAAPFGAQPPTGGTRGAGAPGPAAAGGVIPVLSAPRILARDELRIKVPIRDIRIENLDATLSEPFGIASDLTSKDDATENVLVVVETEWGITGIGEAAPFFGISGDTRELIIEDLKKLIPLIEGRELNVFELEAIARKTLRYPAAMAAVEMALFDALAKKHGKPLAKLLNPGFQSRTAVTDITIPITTAEEAGRLAELHLEQGFRRIKIKVGDDLQTAVGRVRAVVDAHKRVGTGDRLEVSLDANEGYTKDQAIALVEKLYAQGIVPTIFEQPVARGDIEGMKAVRKMAAQNGVLIFADESVYTVADARRLIKEGAVDGINLKLMKHGGIIETLRIAELTLQNGHRLMIGGMVETRLAMTTSLHVAGAIGIDILDLDTPLLLTEDAILGGTNYEGPRLSLPEGAGIGVRRVGEPLGTAPEPEPIAALGGALESVLSPLSSAATRFASDIVDIFVRTTNPALGRVDLGLPLPGIDTFPLTKAVFERVLAYREESTGKNRGDITVVVPGYRTNPVEVTNWLSLGVRVVAVEIPRRVRLLRNLVVFDDVLKKASDSGMLVIREIGEKMPEADIIVWTMPDPIPAAREEDRLSEQQLRDIRHEELVAGLAGDGIVVTETEFSSIFRGFDTDPRFQVLVPPTETGSWPYLLPTLYSGDFVRAAIYQRISGSIMDPDGGSTVNDKGAPSSGPADTGSRGGIGEPPPPSSGFISATSSQTMSPSPIGGIRYTMGIPSDWRLGTVSSPGYEPGLSVVGGGAAFSTGSNTFSFIPPPFTPVPPVFVPIPPPPAGVLVK